MTTRPAVIIKNWPPQVEYLTSLDYSELSDMKKVYSSVNTEPCGCEKPPIINNNDNDNEMLLCCNTLQCVLFACQEECRANCKAGEFCGNKRIQSKKFKKLEIFFTHSKKGRGVKALEDIRKGDFVIEYLGAVHEESYLKDHRFLFPNIKKTINNNNNNNNSNADNGVISSHVDATEEGDIACIQGEDIRHRYIMSLQQDIFLDARFKGNEARFINHSCEPNCKLDRWNVRGYTRVAFFALRNIEAGEELTFDYAWEPSRKLTPCLCGTPSCRGSLEIREAEPLDDEDDVTKWVKGTVDTASKIKNDDRLQIFFDGNGEYFHCTVIKRGENNKVMVCYDIDDEERWEDLDEMDFLVESEEAQAFTVISKKANTPLTNNSETILGTLGIPLPQALSDPSASSTPTQTKVEKEIPTFNFPIELKIREELERTGVFQNCESHFSVQLEFKLLYNELNCFVTGANSSRALLYIKKNIAEIQSRESSSFSDIAGSVIYVPAKDVEAFDQNISKIRNICRNNASISKLNVKSLSQFTFYSISASLVSDLQKCIVIISSYTQAYFYCGAVSIPDHLSYITHGHQQLNEEISSDADYKEIISDFERAHEDCSVFFTKTLDQSIELKYDTFIKTHPRNIQTFFQQFTQMLDELNDQNVLYLRAPSLLQEASPEKRESFEEFLGSLGVHISRDCLTNVWYRIKAGAKVPKSEARCKMELAKSYVLSQIRLLQIKATRESDCWLYGDLYVAIDKNPLFSLNENVLLEILEITLELKLDSSVAIHASLLLLSFLGKYSSDKTGTNLSNAKIREYAAACLHICSKAQKMHKWKKLEQVLQICYKVWFKTSLDLANEEAKLWENKIIAAETLILKTLEYKVFFCTVDAIIRVNASFSSTEKKLKVWEKLIYIMMKAGTFRSLLKLVKSHHDLSKSTRHALESLTTALWLLNTDPGSNKIHEIMSTFGITSPNVLEAMNTLLSEYHKDGLEENKNFTRMYANYDVISGVLKVLLNKENVLSPVDQLVVTLKNNNIQRFAEKIETFSALEVIYPDISSIAVKGDARSCSVFVNEVKRKLGPDSTLDTVYRKSTVYPRHQRQRNDRLLEAHVSKKFEAHPQIKNTPLLARVEKQACGFAHFLPFRGKFKDNGYWLQECHDPDEINCELQENQAASNMVSTESKFTYDVSLIPWPSKKMVQRERLRIKNSLSMGFSAAALQEMHLLHQLHAYSNTNTGNPHFIFPASIRQVEDEAHLVLEPHFLSLQSLLTRRRHTGDCRSLVTPVLMHSITHDLLSALAHCHENHIILRTVNPETILLDSCGRAKLSSLNCNSMYACGERQQANKDEYFVHKSNTKEEKGKKKKQQKKGLLGDKEELRDPYIAPEILLGGDKYTYKTDVWCVASVLAYLLLNKPLFTGKDCGSHIKCIFKIVGSCSEETYPELKAYHNYKKFKPAIKYKRAVTKALKSILGTFIDDYKNAFDCIVMLLDNMLYLDPRKRMSPSNCLKHPQMAKTCIRVQTYDEEYAEDWGKLYRTLTTGGELVTEEKETPTSSKDPRKRPLPVFDFDEMSSSSADCSAPSKFQKIDNILSSSSKILGAENNDKSKSINEWLDNVIGDEGEERNDDDDDDDDDLYDDLK